MWREGERGSQREADPDRRGLPAGQRRKGGKRIGDDRLNPASRQPRRVPARGSIHGVLTRARPNGTLESVAGDSITHWRQCQTRGRRFVVAFACVVEALPVPSRKHWRLPAMDGASAVWLVPALGAAAYDKLGFAMVADAAMRFLSFLNTPTAYDSGGGLKIRTQ
jgi:hypothetical protein